MRIAKFGNSAAVRIPKNIMSASSLKFGSEIGLRLLDNGCILLTPQTKITVDEDRQSLAAKESAPPPVAEW